MFSELNRISSEEQLEALMDEVMEQGLEGLVLKGALLQLSGAGWQGVGRGAAAKVVCAHTLPLMSRLTLF